MVELQKRDQDKWQIHIYTDFTGYGVIELLHNLLKQVFDEFKREDRDPNAVFFQLEGLVLFMTMEEQLVSFYLGVDDGDGVCETSTVIVKAFLATLHLLHQHGLLKSDGSIKSLRTCITSFLHWLQETPTNTYFKDEEEAYQAPGIIAAYCDANKLDYKLAHDIDSFVADVKLSPKFTLNKPGDDPYRFKNSFRHLRKEPGGGAQRGHLGYKYYDLTKWPKKCRMEYIYGEDGVDPMDMLGPEFKELDKTLKEPYP
ncbi:hypothetical protein B9Z65_4197 [Elsinoe australis]|uniref:Uncharacterized protein n=1 Tax=Elsinoe australis TaxID=40998 RepID=A0A2P7Z249_9PEZI|nr:hypothetical protein B9Z65_4197 [Elsinoe australis]